MENILQPQDKFVTANGLNLHYFDWVLTRSDEELLSVEQLHDFAFQKPGPKTFAKVKCTRYGEYVFEPQAHIVKGEPHCIPCSGYLK